MTKSLRYASVVLGIGVFMSAGAAGAAQVTVTGGFTGFEGLVSQCDNVQDTLMLNNQITCNPTADEVYDSVTFPIVSQVIAQFTEADLQGQLGLSTPNVVLFTPATAQNVAGTGDANRFLIGTLTFANGIWGTNNALLPVNGVNTATAGFPFKLTTHSVDPTLDGKTFTDEVILVITGNNFGIATPEANSDLVYLLHYPQLGAPHAYELQDSPLPGQDNTVQIQIFGHIDSNGSVVVTPGAPPPPPSALKIDSFANPVGGFLDPGVSPIPTPRPANTAVPNVVGLPLADATKLIDAADLAAGTVTQQSSPSVPVGFVVSEEPVAGTSLAVSSSVDLFLSSGPSTAQVVGDVDGNGVVNCTDVAIVRSSFGKRQGQLGFDVRADVNHDSVVNLIDLATVTRAMPVGSVCH